MPENPENRKNDMDIIDMAVMLGQRIKNEETAERYLKAKEAFDACEELRTSFSEYEVQRMVLAQEANKEEIDNELVKRIDTRIDELFEFITHHPVYTELEQSQAELNALIKKVTDKITEQITGEKPSSGCTHDCSSCSGCS